jgi:hypothetical protein
MKKQMKVYDIDDDTEDYGFFCDLEDKKSIKENTYNKENIDFIIHISLPKKQYHYHYTLCHQVILGISIVITAVIIFSIK